jgi:hypothetical protein
MVEALGRAIDAIVGPGSEWFWAAAQFVVVVVSLAGIYSQLRAQASSNAFHQRATLHERWDSDRLTRARLVIALDTRHPGPDSQVSKMLPAIADFFEDIAMLEEAGHLKRRDVWLDWNRTAEFWWTLLYPAIQQRQVLYPGDYEGFERLAGLMRDLDRKAGRVNSFDEQTVADILEDLIATLSAWLRMELDSKAGIIPTAQPKRRGRG